MEKLLEVRKHQKIGKIDLNENDVRSIVLKAREIFLSQPVLLELGRKDTVSPLSFSIFLQKLH
jgi:hypothetical protein